jgi:hypothetical protein
MRFGECIARHQPAPDKEVENMVVAVSNADKLPNEET